MSRGQNEAEHPGRKVHRERFNDPHPDDVVPYRSLEEIILPNRRGGNFGQGPPLEKNESGRGYHVKGAPGFR